MNQPAHTGALEPVSPIELALQKVSVDARVIRECQVKARDLTRHPFPDKAAFEYAKRARLDMRQMRLHAEKVLEGGKREAKAVHKAWCDAENTVTKPLEACEEQIAAAEQEFLTREQRMREEKQAAHDRAVADRKARLLAIDFLFNGQRYFYTLLDGTELGIDKADIESREGNDIDFGTWLVQMEQEVSQDKAARAARAEQEQAEQRRVEAERQELARLRAEEEGRKQEARMLKRSTAMLELGAHYDDVERTYHLGSLVWTRQQMLDMLDESFDGIPALVADEKRALEQEAVRQRLAAVEAQRRKRLFDMGYSIVEGGWAIGGERADIGPELAGYGDDLWEAMVVAARDKSADVRQKREHEMLIEIRAAELVAAGWEDGGNAMKLDIGPDDGMLVFKHTLLDDGSFTAHREIGRTEMSRRAFVKQKAEEAAREQQRLANLDERGRLQELLAQVQAITIPEVRNEDRLYELQQDWVNEINAAIEAL